METTPSPTKNKPRMDISETTPSPTKNKPRMEISESYEELGRVNQPSSEQEQFAMGMPKLDGKPLQSAQLHPVDWHQGQRFTLRDDPDRTTLAWNLPEFLKTTDPVERSKMTKATEIKPPNSGSSSFARSVSNVFTESECATLLAAINSKGFTPALLNIGRGNQMFNPDGRDGFRIIQDSPELADWLFKVLRPHLPETTEIDFKGEIKDINARCRFLYYKPGQSFPAHQDGRYTSPGGETSQVTIQVYFHDIPKENGGATTFLDWDETTRVPYHPKAGSVLLFTQDLYHEGSMVNAGMKYTMRTEVMYTPLGPL